MRCRDADRKHFTLEKQDLLMLEMPLLEYHKYY